MAEYVEFTGKDLEEALAVAAASLKLPPEQIKFKLLTMGSKGLWGLGRRKARISVDPDDPSLDLGDEVQAKDAGPVRSAAAAESTRPRERAQEESRPNTDLGDSAQTDRADKARKPKAPRAARPEKPAASGKRDQSPAVQPDRAAARAELKPLDWAHVPPPLTRPGPGESEQAALPDDEAGRKAEEVVLEITGRMGLEVKSSRRRLGSRLVISLDSPDNALLIGNRGGTLEALQLLAAKIITQRVKSTASETGSEDRLVLDVADYRARRQSQLLENLKNMAEEARSSGKPQSLGSLSPAERRLALLALRPFKDLSIAPGSGRESLVITSVSDQRSQRSARPRKFQRPRRGGDRKSSA